MKMMKKTLSMLLVLTMLLGMVPLSVFAADATNIGHMATKPADGKTVGEPFPENTANSYSFRIPGLVTLSDGTLVAAADARWDTTYDGGGLDTIVARSTDGGANWNYTFANYLGDNGNKYNGSSTCFIDPSLAVTANDTIYMLVDLYPAGVALNGNKETTPATTTGFNSDGYLLLTDDGYNKNNAKYEHYLKNGRIYTSQGAEVSGYTVDAYFNVFKNDSYHSNLFFADCDFSVVRTGFLYLTKSTDKGATWSAPTLLNLKTSSEMVCLVGPGRGLVTSKGTIVFPVYSYNGENAKYTGLIYSEDNGASWDRTSNLGTAYTSEATVVELGNGNLRVFVRNENSQLTYYDYNLNGNSLYGGRWGNKVTTGVACNSDTELSAITYSRTVDGKQVILVSAPTGPNAAGTADNNGAYRSSGKIFMGLINDDYTMTWKSSSVAVTTVATSAFSGSTYTAEQGFFAYSCLTEQKDNGSVSILYEDSQQGWGAGNGYGYTMAFKTYTQDSLESTFGVTFDAADGTKDAYFSQNGGKITGLNLVAGLAAQDVTINNVDTASQNVTAVSNNTGVATVTVSGNVLTITPVAAGSTTITVTVANNTRAATVGTYTLPVNVAATASVENIVNVRIPVGSSSETYTDQTGNYQSSASIMDNTVANMTVVGITTPGGTSTQLVPVTTITSGSSYYISDGNGNFLSMEGDGRNGYSLTNTTDITAATQWTVTKNSNNNTYKVSYKTWNNTYYVRLYNNTLALGTDNSSNNHYYADGKGFYCSGNGTNVWIFSNGSWTIGSDGENSAKLYTYEEVQKDPVNQTEVYFSGLKVGTTTAVVGTTQYNITVYQDVDVQINYTCDGKIVATGTVKIPSDAKYTDTVTLPATVTDGTDTYKVDNTTLTLSNGIATTYSVSVTLQVGTPISIAVDETQKISATLGAGQYVQWSCADSSYVGVAGVYNVNAGAYGNEALIAGYNETSAPVLVTGTIYNQDGTKAGEQKWLVTVTESTKVQTGTGDRTILLTVDKLENCDVYYSINGGALVKVNGTGVLIDKVIPSPELFNIMFFAAPKEGYALTMMSLSNTNGEYFSLCNGNPDGTDSEAWPFVDPAYNGTVPANGDAAWKSGHGFRWALIQGNLTIEQMKVLFANAIALGCVGATNVTMNNLDNGQHKETSLEFVADPLPKVEKTLNGVLPSSRLTSDFRRYQGTKLTAIVGDYVYFNIRITIEVPKAWYKDDKGNATRYGLLEFEYAKIHENLGNAYFYTKAQDTNSDGVIDGMDTGSGAVTTQDIADLLNAAWKDEEIAAGKRVIELYAVYPITVDDLGKYIVNTVILDYEYTSKYTAGTFEEKGEAVADILVAGGSMPNVVIDFGLPVTVLDKNNSYGFGTAKEYYEETKAKLKYGEIVFAQQDGVWQLTYTPIRVMQGAETVFLYDGKGDVINSFLIYPATTIYYEETFLGADEENWIRTDGPSGNQEFQEIGCNGNGHNHNIYGYDSFYEDKGTNTGYITSNRSGATAEFTFTGTGFQLFGNSESASGIILVRSQGNLNKLYLIDTKLTDLDGNAVGGTYYGLPFISETNLPYGTYTVTIKQTGDNSIHIDGVRVFNTFYDETRGEGNVYYGDEEDNPDFYEVRDFVLKALGVEGLQDSQYTDTADRVGLANSIKDLANQIYNAIAAENASAVILAGQTQYPDDDDQTRYTDEELKNLLDNGPKNELYLYPGQTLVFNIQTNRVIQLGLKAPTGSAKFEITVTSGTETKTLDLTSLSTPVDMFYKLIDKDSANTNRTVTVSISVKDGLLSTTLLKICDDPNVTFPALTKEDVENTMLAMYDLNNENEPDHSYTSEETKAPTCTEKGVMTYTCACGDTYTEEIAATGEHADSNNDHSCDVCGNAVSVCADSDVDGKCDVCGELFIHDAPNIMFFTTSLSFQEYIGLQFIAKQSVFADYDSFYAVIVQTKPNVDKGTVTGFIEESIQIVGYASGTANNPTYVFNKDIQAWSMTDTVTITLYAVKDGVTYRGETRTTSVMEQAYIKLGQFAGNDQYAPHCKILADMLTYGAAVQVAFDHDALDLPNAKLEELGYSSFVTSTIPNVSAENTVSGTGSMTVRSTSLSLQQKVDLQLIFKGDMTGYKAVVTLEGGEPFEVYPDGNMKKFSLVSLPYKMRDTYTVVICDAETGEPVSPTYTYSVESVAKTKLGSSEAFDKLIYAMLNYGDSVRAIVK